MAVMIELTDLNVLYEAFRASLSGSSWKSEAQRFELDYLSELIKIKEDLENRTYETKPGSEFLLNERGKTRYIHGGIIRDRVVRHAICDNVLTPVLSKYLINNNGASQKGKGISFSRREFEKDLHNYWLKYRTNEGYIVTVDLKKFYDNMQHDKIKEMINPKIDEFSQWLFSRIVDDFAIDVSYMTDEEYSHCLDNVFDSIEYHKQYPIGTLNKTKMMPKSVDIGDQVSQNIGIFFPTWIDNYCKIVLGIKWYGRYMDDIYFIVRTVEEAHIVVSGIEERAKEIGLFVNTKKTRICKLSKEFTYLQTHYWVTDTGRVVKKIKQKAVTRERRKIKAYKRLLDRGEMPYADIENAYKSWMGNFAAVMSKRQIKNMKRLYIELFGKDVRWKKQLSHSSSRTEHRSREQSTATTTSHSRQSQRTCLMTCP